MGTGFILLVIGLVFFLGNFGIEVPDWIFSWSTLVFGIGLFIGFKRNFQGGKWLALVLIGGYFTIEHMIGVDLSDYFFAFGFIALGAYLLLKSNHKLDFKHEKAPVNFN